eukprot:scaffold297034_cov31-Prasinocladus_malaysianus.AAC.1
MELSFTSNKLVKPWSCGSNHQHSLYHVVEIHACGTLAALQLSHLLSRPSCVSFASVNHRTSTNSSKRMKLERGYKRACPPAPYIYKCLPTHRTGRSEAIL